MNHSTHASLLLVLVVILGGRGGVLELPSEAQVIPDQTLGSESSVVESDTLGGDHIQGGARRGGNLFHSFERFDISPLQQVYFHTPIGIETILSRVTGTNRSEIMGTLGVDGNADLFLLNPNGIVFGPNARLDMGGSFVATSADALQFGEVGTFSGRDPETPSPLLTIAPSAFLFGREPAGNIVNRSTVVGLTDGGFPNLAVGLRVPNGENLLLLGSKVVLDGGRLSAFGGYINIGAVAGPGTVGLNNDGSFAFPDEVVRGSVRLENDSVVDGALDGGGDIQVTAATIDILSSVVKTGIRRGFGEIGSQAGDIILDATDYIYVADRPILNNFGGVLNEVAANAIGNSGNIIITTPVLEVRNAGQISSGTFGQGNAGSIHIDASDRILIDVDPLALDHRTDTGISSDVKRKGVGNAGSITIQTSILEVLNTGVVASSTFGEGSAGRIQIEASDRILIDVDAFAFEINTATGILSTVERKARGDAGSITIQTPLLEIWNTGRIDSSTFSDGNGGRVDISASDRILINLDDFALNSGAATGILSDVGVFAEGDAGSITIHTPLLEIRNAGVIASGTFGNGNAGRVSITASDRIFLDNGFILSEVDSDTVANGGNIRIKTPILHMQNESQISAENFVTGDAGNVIVVADLIDMENESSIFTRTVSGDGGNILINPVSNAGDLLLMQSSSTISTSAGTSDNGGDGGNIAINIRFINTVPQSNSDITANAFTGRGGNIDITASGGLFGIEFRPQQTPRSDITASSQFGLDGDVVINTPDIDPSQGLVQLPVNPINLPPIDAVCNAAVQAGSEFIFIGRGGIPANPTDSLGTSLPWEDWYIAESLSSPALSSVIPHAENHYADGHSFHRRHPPATVIANAITEAQGWIKTGDGHVSLIPHPAIALPISPTPPLDCRHLSSADRSS